jgi:hypothetical protein
MATALPPWLCGVWRRNWIERRGAARSSEVSVDYLQTPALFADLRVARDRPRIAATSFADATDAELAVLASQQGFAGHATLDGDVLTWHHALDFQPTAPGEIDAGRVEQVEGGMFEHALDGAYLERWERIADGDGRFFAAEARTDGRLDALCVMAGDAFIVARNRAADLPPVRSLGELVGDARVARETKIAYLDCEIAAGHAHGPDHVWMIERSTLPWHEGRTLAAPFSVENGALSMRAGWVLRVNTFALGDLALRARDTAAEAPARAD